MSGKKEIEREGILDAIGDIIAGNFVSKEEKKRRLDICYACPHLISGIVLCKKCKCEMLIKAGLKKHFCPIRKW